MPQTFDDLMAQLDARRKALQVQNAAPATPPDSQTASGIDPDVDAVLARIEARRKANASATPTTEIPTWRHLLAAVPRIAGPWLGAAGAGALATPETLGLGTLPAAAAGGATGGAIGEYLAEKIEGRAHVNPAQIAAQGVIGAIPVPGGPLLSRVLKGGAQQALAAGLTESAETGKFPSTETLSRGALLGGGIGAAGRLLERTLGRSVPEAEQQAERLTVSQSLPTGAKAYEGADVQAGGTVSTGGRTAIPPVLQKTLARAKTPGRVPNEPAGGFPEGPEDTGLPATSAVGGAPAFHAMPTVQPVLRDVGEGAINTVRQELSRRGVTPPADLPYGSPARAQYTAQLAEHAGTVQETLREQLGDTIPVFRATKPGEGNVVSVSIDPEEAKLYAGEGGDVVAGHVPVESIVGPGEEAHELLLDKSKAGGALQPKPRIPTPITALWQDLQPKWQESLDQQAGDEIPFTVDPREDLIPFAKRIMSEDPRQLMGAERKIRATLDAATGGDVGAISPELLTRLGLVAGGGVGGAALDREHPIRGALAGAGLAALASNPAAASRLRYFSMLSSPVTQAKILAGHGVGAVGSRAAELAATGQGSKALGLLKSFFSPETIERARELFHEPSAMPDLAGSVGPLEGVAGLPSRVAGSVIGASKDAMQRAGETADQAAVSTLSNRPMSKFGRAVLGLHDQGGPVGKLLVPFARTAVNLAERGMERIPGVGMLPAVRGMQHATVKEATARQALGALAGLVGSQLGAGSPLVAAAAGPYALPLALGGGVGAALRKKNATGKSAGAAAGRALQEAVPLPRDATSYDPSDVLASYVPNFLSLLSRVDPKSLATPGIFDPAIAKIPILNELLLQSKRGVALTKYRKAQTGR